MVQKKILLLFLVLSMTSVVCSQIKVNEEDPFDGILGLRWGMRMELAINKLENIGLSSWVESDDYRIVCVHKTSWNGILYDAVALEYYISNKQNKYLREIGFLKFCDSAEKAKSIREDIAISLKLTYGSDALREDVGDNGFKRYEVRAKVGEGITVNRIDLFVSSKYSVVIKYNGAFEAARAAYNDDNNRW